jgi:hypothetical protein
MPGSYAHYRFGAQLLPILRPEVRRVVKRHRALFDMGLHGPDIFFYHNIWRKTPIVKLGYQLHRTSGATIFTRAAKRLRLEPSEPGLAYLFGLLAHYCLDCHCHPRVHELTDEGALDHVELETEFDRHLLVLDEKTPPSIQDCSLHMRLTDEECAVVAAFYPGVSWQDVAKSVRTLAMVTRLLATPSGKFREVVNKTLPKNFAAMLMFDEPDPLYSLHDEDLLACYDRALETFPGLEKQITAYLTCGVPLSDGFTDTFG